MKYSLRNFENNYQIVASLGWIFAILGVILFFVAPIPVGVFFLLIGSLLILLQLRGKRIHVDTGSRTIKGGGITHQINAPSQIFMNEVVLSQRVNSRAQSTNVKMYFYKAYLQDGDEKVLLSSNRKESRDMARLESIAKDLKIELVKNY